MYDKVDQVLGEVEELEAAQGEYRELAKIWENMWGLVPPFTEKDSRKVVENEGREQITLPTPRNVVHLTQRLVASDPKIDVYQDAEAEGDEHSGASLREQWLTAFWQRVGREQQRELLAEAVWLLAVRGRCAFDVRWVRPMLPKSQQKRRLPVTVRLLDPLKVGVRDGAFGPTCAYHRYDESVAEVLRRYPELSKRRKWRGGLADEDLVTVIDFWYLDRAGDVWNSLVIGEDFALTPRRMDYPDIPITLVRSEAVPVPVEKWRGISILDSIKDLWPYQCRLASQIGTGILYYMWPVKTFKSSTGRLPPKFSVRPGAVVPLDATSELKFERGDVNVPLATSMISLVESNVQMSTFPGVMYGQAPGELSAGYGVSLLADAARGRVNPLRVALESGIERVNEQVLGLIEAMAPAEGVTVWGRNAGTGRVQQAVLKPSDIDGQYANSVSLTPQITQDQIAQQTMAMRMVETGLFSKQTVRDRHVTLPTAPDEQKRIDYEQIMQDPAMVALRGLRAIQHYHPADWEDFIVPGSAVEKILQAMQPREAQPEQAAGSRPGLPPGAQVLPDGTVLMNGQPIGRLPPPGRPGPQVPQPPQQPGLDMQPPGVQGLPPQLAGQITPQMLGIPGGPQVNPGLFRAALGRPLTPDEEEEALLRQRGLTP